MAQSSSIHDPGTVLVVDDTAATRDLLTSLLTREGYRVECADDGRAVPGLVRAHHPDLVLMDVLMPHVDGFSACAALKSDPATRLTPVVLITGLDDSESRVRGIDAGADDFLTKPFNLVELRARVRSLVRIKRYTDDLDSAEAAIVSLALTIEARDPFTNGHCQRLAAYAARLGAAVGLSDDDLTALTRGAFLHDIGKVGIADAILLKPGPLTRDEYHQMQQHTVIGDRVCSQLRSLRKVRPIVRHHHERLDGSGYPDGLRGDQIPLLAQITGVLDVFDALTAARPYRSALTVEAAMDELRQEVKRGWRRHDLVDTWIELNNHLRMPDMSGVQNAIVLVVDDEAPMRQLERRILETGPYEVIEASGAAAAFQILASGQHVDLLIADLDMPELPGEEMVVQVRASRPGLKVLYVSANVDRLLDARQILEQGEAFVDKPFTAKALLEGVSLLLYDTLTPPAR